MRPKVFLFLQFYRWAYVQAGCLHLTKPSISNQKNGGLCPCWVHVLNSIWRPLRKPSQGFRLSSLNSGVHVPSLPQGVKMLGDPGILDDRVGIAERPWPGMWASSQRVLSNCGLSSLPCAWAMPVMKRYCVAKAGTFAVCTFRSLWANTKPKWPNPLMTRDGQMVMTLLWVLAHPCPALTGL